ncbi:MAG: SPOR domain-containing protein [Acidobacteriota bacterium]
MSSRWLALLTVALLAPRLFATTSTVTLEVRETRHLQILGLTAAWAIDANIVDAVAVEGGVTLFARNVGRTRVMVIGVTGENSLDVLVEAKQSTARANEHAGGAQTFADVRYSSANRELQTGVTLTAEETKRRTVAEVRVVQQTSDDHGGRPSTSLPVVSYSVFTPGRELTLFDRDVVHSPLTLSGTPVRGVHYLDDHWRLHAGYTAYAAYQSFLVPVQRELVVGAAYAFRTGARSTWTPGLFAYPGQGTVLSLLYDHRFEASALRAEAGFSDGLGGALQYTLDTERDQARVDLRYRPRHFAVLGSGESRGLRADANWNHAYGRGSNAAFSMAASELGRSGDRVAAASADFNQRVTDRLSILGGASWGSFEREGSTTRSLTLPAGLDLHFARGGVTALYRYARSGTNRGGHGGRVAGRAALGRFHVSAYADRQQNAPTLEVIFSEQPELALALSELGISVNSPSDLARVLRENAALLDLGFIEGVNIDFAPMRTQVGFEASWLGASAARQQVRTRLLYNVVEGVASRRATALASLTYSRRMTSAIDLFAGVTYWRTERRGVDADVRRYFEAGVRGRFDGAPLLGGGRGTISGVVFADEDLDGVSDGTGVVAEVELDGTTRQQTAGDGTFAFRQVPRGAHRVTARVDKPGAYFTTPSRASVQPGEQVAFGVATTPAHVIVSVTSDAGRGLAGVRLLLASGPRQIEASTDSAGAFTAAVAPGQWAITMVLDSIPADHSLVGSEARTVTLDRGEPGRVEWQLLALRSVSGTGAPPYAEIAIEPMGKRVHADARGNFAVRLLPAGELTVIVGNEKRTVVLPPEPISLTLDFAGAISLPALPALTRVARGTPVRTLAKAGAFVQIGAYRIRANAEETLQRARRSGVDASLRVRGVLTIVSAGPYRTRAEADRDAARLTDAGLDAVVTISR